MLKARLPRAAYPWVSRCLLALVAPVAFLIALEIGLRLAGCGQDTALFVADDVPGYLRTNPHFTLPYFPEQFDIYPLNFRIKRSKEPGHIRIFVLGESAAKGTPEPGFGFASVMAAQLRSAYPDLTFEVFNLGIVAVNSHVVYQVARQVAALEPDLLVVYMGNNEVVGPFGPGSANLSAVPPLWMIRAAIAAGGTRTGQLMRRLVGVLSGSAAGRRLEWHGMSTFTDKTVRGDDPRLGRVERNYEANLRGIVGISAALGIHTVVATVVANLSDCPPFVSLHKVPMPAADLDRWSRLYREGTQDWELDDTDDAIRVISDALAIDPQYAEAHYLLGTLLSRRGDAEGARVQFLEALHWDALRFRPDAGINAAARRVAAAFPGTVRLVDTALELGSDRASRSPPSGRGILLEHVHFSWEGNLRMGRILAENSAAALFGKAPPPGAWLDDAGCARAVGYTAFGRLRTLELMESIRGKAPFTQQLTFGVDQSRYRHESDLAAAQAAAPGAADAAAAQIGSALAVRPDDTALLLRLSEVESRSGRPARALAHVEKAVHLLPRSAELLTLHARALSAAGRDEEAQAEALESIHLDPDNLPSYTALVDALRKTGHFEAGKAVFDEALARSPAAAFVRLSYADLLFFHGERDQAVRECMSVLGREPENEDALRRLVSLYTAEGRKEEALSLMVGASRAQPLNFENNLALARIYEERGDEDRAFEYLRAAASSGPATAQAHLYLAKYLHRKGRSRDALLELARARRIAVVTEDTQLASQISEAMLRAHSE